MQTKKLSTFTRDHPFKSSFVSQKLSCERQVDAEINT